MHDRYHDAIQELADGTLGQIRRAELQQHLDECAPCRQLADDLARIHDLAASLPRPAPPARVWRQIAGRLRQEGRLAAPAPFTAASRRYAPLAIAASLLLIVGASLYLLYPRDGQPDTAGNAAPTGTVQSVDEEFRLAELHLQNAISRLQEAAKSGDDPMDTRTAATLKENLQVIDHAISESRAALKSEPASAPAARSLFDALRRKVILLQDTIALMNQMRKGDAAGTAQILDSDNKS